MPLLFAVCTPGLEPLVTQELVGLGLSAIHSSFRPEDSPTPNEFIDEVGGVEFPGSLRDLYRANLHLRTASRVFIRLGGFHADTFSDLRRRAKRLSWENYLRPGQAVSLRVACHKSRLYHSVGVAERVIEAIGNRLGQVPPVQKLDQDENANHQPQLIVVRLVRNQCTVSMDSSGALLHRRGYRLATGKAPLRETLAAGILLASGWDASSPLLDPFCGSGTIAIEAALMARKIPPGIKRNFAFMDWPNFDGAMWKELVAESKTIPGVSRPKIIASDRDAGAIQFAEANAERASVADFIEFSCRPISAIDPPKGLGWVVTNPPYGVRLSTSQDLRKLYAQLGRVLRMKCPGWQVALLSNSAQLLGATGLEFEPGIRTRNGGLRVILVKGRIE